MLNLESERAFIFTLLNLGFSNEFSTAIDLEHRSVYIACPPGEAKFIESVAAHIREDGILVHTTETLTEWLKDNRKVNTCEVAITYFEEVLSIVEQRLLTQVEHFLSWPVSSWSGRVHQLQSSLSQVVISFSLVQFRVQMDVFSCQPPTHITYEGIQVRERNFTLVDLLIRDVNTIHEEF